MLEKTKLMKLKDKVQLLEADHPDILDENNEFPTGTDLTLNSTGDLPMKVDVGGNSTQVQYEGYNKLSAIADLNDTINNITIQQSGGIYKLNGTASQAGFVLSKIFSNQYTIQEGDYLQVLNNGISNNALSAFNIGFTDNTSIQILLDVTNKIIDLSPYVGKTAYVIRCYCENGATFNNMTAKPMIVNSSTQKEFEPYTNGLAVPNPNQESDINNVEGNVVVISKNSDNTKSNSVTFPLSQGQKLMLGDTLEDDGIHHKRGQIVLNGTESISINTNYTTNDLLVAQFPETLFNNVISGTNQCLCSHFKYYSSSTIKNTFRFAGKFLLCTLDRSEYSTVEDFKTYLAEQYANGTPVTVEYELETETIDPYTPEQQTAYNKLKEMQSYYDLTYVTGSSDNAQPIITAHAKKSLKVMQDEIDNIESRLSLLE